MDILDLIHTVCMKEKVEKHYAWQPNLFRHTFNPKEYQKILLDGRIIGFLKVVETDIEIYIANLMLHPNFQNLGIGTRILQQIIHQSQQKRKLISLQVLKYNRARSLYERLGFYIVEITKCHYKMKRNIDFNS